MSVSSLTRIARFSQLANLSDLRLGIANNIAAVIPTLRVADTIPDLPNPPIAVVSVDTVDFNRSMHNGLSEFGFVVTVIVGRASERSAQNSLDAICGSGAGSIKAAVEVDKTLGGKAYDTRLVRMNNYGSVSIGEIDYLSADFSVTVFAL